MTQNKPDPEGLAAARRLAGWELGYTAWADKIIEAYLNPEAAHARLDADEAPAATGIRSDRRL